MKFFFNLIKFFIIFLLLTSNAFSYFDPGTGAFILQTIIAFISVLIFFFLHPIESIKSFLRKFKKNKDKKKDTDSLNDR